MKKKTFVEQATIDYILSEMKNQSTKFENSQQNIALGVRRVLIRVKVEKYGGLVICKNYVISTIVFADSSESVLPFLCIIQERNT